jgi:hypothetical protein
MGQHNTNIMDLTFFILKLHYFNYESLSHYHLTLSQKYYRIITFSPL